MEDLFDNYSKVLEPTETGIVEVLERFHDLIKNRYWDIEENRKAHFKEYMERYAPPDLSFNPFYFKFSEI